MPDRAAPLDPAEGLIPISKISPACWCGSTEPPLHPGASERIADGVVRDTVVCTAHMEVAR